MKYSKLFLTIISGVLIFSCTKPGTTAGEFIFVATGNVQGSLKPYKIRLDSLGGLPRRATFLKDLRSTGKDPILLDAGNLFNEQDNSIGLIKCYNEIGYDALNIGAQDLANAINISNLEKAAEFPFISANIIHRQSGEPVFKPFTIVERNGIILAIIGLTNNLLDNSSAEYGIKDPKWAVNMHFKSAFACTSFLMILFGLSLSIRRPRSSLAVGIGISVFVIFVYYAAITTGRSFGYKGTLEPFISVWFPNLIFFITGIHLFRKTRS